MQENRRILFHLEKVGNSSAVERGLAKVNGVLSVKVNAEEKTLDYVIDEWASDYDVFTEVMRICAESGCSIDFNYDDQVQEETKEELTEIVAEEIPPEVEEKAEEIAPEKEEDSKKKISDRMMRVIELGIAVVAYIVSLFLTDIAEYIFLAISFAVAGYDALYEAFVKITKKQIFSEELVISLAFFASILLGYPGYAVISLLLYSVIAFARKIIREEIDKNPAFSKSSKKFTVESEEGVKNVELKDLKIGETVLLEPNEICAFDAILRCFCEVENFKGEKRLVHEGDHVYLGERILTSAQVEISAFGEDCKFGKLNKVINDASQKICPVAKKMQQNEQLYSLILFAVCAIIAFIPPIFSTTYLSGLYRWGYTAVIIATISGLGFYTFSSEINMLSALVRGRRYMLAFSSYEAVKKIANAKGLYIDYESALKEGDGEKADSFGAIRELKDAKVENISLVCSLEDEKAENLCKQLKIKEYYSRENEDQKIEVLNQRLNEGGAVVTTANVCEKLTCEKGAVISFNCESEGYKGDACISSDEIAYLPYAVKLAKRTARIQKSNLVIGIAVKCILVILACFGFAQLWWAVLADTIVSLISAISAFLNGREVY